MLDDEGRAAKKNKVNESNFVYVWAMDGSARQKEKKNEHHWIFFGARCCCENAQIRGWMTFLLPLFILSRSPSNI